VIVDPREAIGVIPLWLTEKLDVTFIWGKAVTDIAYPTVFAGTKEFEADVIYVCSGSDFETLYPEIFSQQPITKCKLQMMRLSAPDDGERVGPALCGGLSLIHYTSFRAATSLPLLTQKYEREYAEYLQHGIHVMAAQNQAGEITVGDSHEYASSPDPFDSMHINKLILAYLDKFAIFGRANVVQTWNGIYPKLMNGQTDLVLTPEPGVTIINGVGGAGMTLSFGLASEVVGE
jgi:FAD dependent oxidoreductase TIGR03364